MSMLLSTFFVPEAALEEINDWSKEQIVAYLILCSVSGMDYDYGLLHGMLKKTGMKPETFFAALSSLDIDYDEVKREREAMNNRQRSLPRRKTETLYVYLVRNPESGLLKIGITGNLARRFKQIAQGKRWEVEVVKTFASTRARDIEAAFKRQFSACNLKGEWFDLSEVEALAFLEEVQS